MTPDSFYAGSRKADIKQVLHTAETMLREGAIFLDVGGYSSRPGARDISEEEELKRIEHPVKALAKTFPEAIISIDTFRAKVARSAVEWGAHLVNDVSAGAIDPEMMPTVGKLSVPYIAMHMRGTPQTMKELVEYDDLLKEVALYFSKKIAQAGNFGIKDVVIDPGFGFAKTIEQNYYLLNRIEYLNFLERPLLIGVSRKSMIWKTLKIEAEDALNGTTVLNTVALLKGASILRVHDVKEAVEAVKLINTLSI